MRTLDEILLRLQNDTLDNVHDGCDIKKVYDDDIAKAKAEILALVPEKKETKNILDPSYDPQIDAEDITYNLAIDQIHKNFGEKVVTQTGSDSNPQD